jgi:hypothetical protein
MDVKLRCDLFNTLVHSIASYAYEVWVDSKKIEVIEVVYQRVLQVHARGEKNNQHIHHAGIIWQVPL